MKHFLLFAMLLYGCSGSMEKASFVNSKTDIGDRKMSIEHATAFDVKYKNGYKIVTINTPWQGSIEPLVYVLGRDDTPVDAEIEKLGDKIILPIEKIICNSTSQIVLLETLGVLDKLKGFPQTQFIYSPKIVRRVENGKIQEVGIEAKMNIESVMAIDPDMVMSFNTGSENRQNNKLKELGIPVVINADYMENSALGRAEWLKFMSVFFDKEDEANIFYRDIVYKYDSLKELVSGIGEVSVFSGSLYGGSWFMPGGNNYGALLFEDARGKYLWKDDKNKGWLNISFEVVYEKAREADVWIGLGSFDSLDKLYDADSRYADFNAFKEKRVYSYMKRVNSAGANDYFESGIIRPDLILADYIKMIHPELLPGHELYYFIQLE